MKGLEKTKILQISELASQEAADAHTHGQHTKVFVKSIVVNTITKSVLTDVALNGAVLDKTFENITYVSGLTITTDRAVIDVLLPTDTDIND